VFIPSRSPLHPILHRSHFITPSRTFCFEPDSSTSFIHVLRSFTCFHYSFTRPSLTSQQEKPTTSIHSTQSHLDWINALLLIDQNRTIVSASSDGTIKAFRPSYHSHSSSLSHDEDQNGVEGIGVEPTIIGQHNDYVRALTKATYQPWIASGSFDRTIKLWDPTRSSSAYLSSGSTSRPGTSHAHAQGHHTPQPLLTLTPPTASNDPKTSVYALTVSDAWGSIIVSGGPERVVRLWDARIGGGGGGGKGIGTLVGHTDVVRSVVAGWGGDYVSLLFSILSRTSSCHYYFLHSSFLPSFLPFISSSASSSYLYPSLHPLLRRRNGEDSDVFASSTAFDSLIGHVD
jgi:WD repeat-containing protein 48